MGIQHIGVDTETHPFSPGNIAPRLVATTVSRFNGSSRTQEIYNRQDSFEVWRELLTQPDPLVAAFAAFDLAVVQANWPSLSPLIFARYEAGDIRCILIREALHILAIGELQDDRSRAMLKLNETYFRRCGKTLTGKKDGPDGIRLNFDKLENVPLADWPAEAVQYAIQDAVAASEIFSCQEDLPDEANQTRASFALYLMACTGFRADGAKVHRLRQTLEARVAKMNTLLIPTGIIRPSLSRNLNLIKALVAEQYEALDRNIPYVIKKGKAKREEDAKVAAGADPKEPGISYNKDALKELPCAPSEQGGIVGVADVCDPDKHVVCANPLHWLKARQEDEGELTKYVAHLENAVTAPVNYTVTSLVSTGRTAISNPPLQQLPRRPGVRQCIIPPEGHWFIGADYAAIELTTLGQILLDMFGHSLLAQTIQQGRDPHCLTGSMLAGTDYDTFVHDLKQPTTKKAAKNFRQLGKGLVFGAAGGLGAESFVEFARLVYGYKYPGTKDEQIEGAKKHLRQVKAWYPDIAEYLKRVGRACDEGGGFFDLVQPWSGRIRGRVSYTQASNSPWQGLAGDLAKLAIWKITKEMYQKSSSPLYGCRIVVFMHDELLSQAPCEIAAEAAERQSELMIEAAHEVCRDVPTKALPWIARCWEKDAESVRDENGRLIPWESKDE